MAKIPPSNRTHIDSPAESSAESVAALLSEEYITSQAERMWHGAVPVILRLWMPVP